GRAWRGDYGSVSGFATGMSRCSPPRIAGARRPERRHIDEVHFVDDLRESPHRGFEPRLRHQLGPIEIGVVNRVIDDVDARRVHVDDAEFAAWTGLGSGVNRDPEGIETA